MIKTLTREQILDIIPHRFENMLLDTVELFEENNLLRGKGTLAFGEGDIDNRDIFLIKENQQKYYNPYMFMEFLALGCITVMEEKIRQGQTALFSSIRKVSIEKVVSEHTVLESDITLKNVSGNFHRFVGSIQTEDGSPVCSMEIMAYGVDFSSEDPDNRETTKRISASFVEAMSDVNSSVFTYKPSPMVFIDSMGNTDTDNRSLLTQYTYPSSHPFTKGHFPGNPVMMGITQLIMFADSAELLIRQLGISEGNIRASGDILKQDGTVVCEIKGLGLQVRDAQIMPEFKTLKMCAFRELVRPEETLYCRVSLS